MTRPGGGDARLTEAATILGVPLEAEATRRLLAYLALLQRWNATYNLTAVRDPEEMLVQHVVDCLAAVAAVHRHAGDAAIRLLDVGSGGGLPGLVIAIVRTQDRVVCVDAVGKKAAFIRQVALELQLKNVEARHARVESMAAVPSDIVTSRAFASLADFVRLTDQHVKAGGVWMAMKGKRPDEEIAALTPSVEVFHVEPLAVPGLSAERCLVWIRRRGEA